MCSKIIHESYLFQLVKCYLLISLEDAYSRWQVLYSVYSLDEEKPCKKNQGWEPLHQEYKANENTNRHNPKKKQKQTINKNQVKTQCKEDSRHALWSRFMLIMVQLMQPPPPIWAMPALMMVFSQAQLYFHTLKMLHWDLSHHQCSNALRIFLCEEICF
jgi:hypothetical protein